MVFWGGWEISLTCCRKWYLKVSSFSFFLGFLKLKVKRRWKKTKQTPLGSLVSSSSSVLFLLLLSCTVSATSLCSYVPTSMYSFASKLFCLVILVHQVDFWWCCFDTCFQVLALKKLMIVIMMLVKVVRTSLTQMVSLWFCIFTQKSIKLNHNVCWFRDECWARNQ